jgi:hypothetical protein
MLFVAAHPPLRPRRGPVSNTTMHRAPTSCCSREAMLKYTQFPNASHKTPNITHGRLIYTANTANHLTIALQRQLMHAIPKQQINQQPSPTRSVSNFRTTWQQNTPVPAQDNQLCLAAAAANCSCWRRSSSSSDRPLCSSLFAFFSRP